jgi:hypothetical protein
VRADAMVTDPFLEMITIMLKLAFVLSGVDTATRYVPVHRQVHTSIGVEVDAGIRDLLEALWVHGFRTEFSCQGGETGERAGVSAHICFARIADAVRFAEGPGDLVITEGERRAWVDFPAAQIESLTRYWTNFAPRTNSPSGKRLSQVSSTSSNLPTSTTRSMVRTW